MEAKESTAAASDDPPKGDHKASGRRAASKGEEADGKGKKAERKRVVTPYTRLVNRVRGLISRIRCRCSSQTSTPIGTFSLFSSGCF